MGRGRIVIGVASFVLAALFLALDLFGFGFTLGRTTVSVYPVILFAGLGVVLIASSRRDRRRRVR
jgi:hypothetical protein